MQKTDFKNCHLIDNDLTHADFSYSYCNDISVSGQKFDSMKMKSIDLYHIELEDCLFSKYRSEIFRYER